MHVRFKPQKKFEFWFEEQEFNPHKHHDKNQKKQQPTIIKYSDLKSRNNPKQPEGKIDVGELIGTLHFYDDQRCAATNYFLEQEDDRIQAAELEKKEAEDREAESEVFRLPQNTHVLSLDDNSHEMKISLSSFGFELKCLGFVCDHYLDGLPLRNISIKGRMDFKNMKKFVKECYHSSKRLITLVSFMSRDQKGPNYFDFIEEFSKSQLTAVYDIMVNDKEVFTLYLMPPSFRKYIHEFIPEQAVQFPNIQPIGDYSDYSELFFGIAISQKVYVDDNGRSLLKFDTEGNLIHSTSVEV